VQVAGGGAVAFTAAVYGMQARPFPGFIVIDWIGLPHVDFRLSKSLMF
jgi:hypothetical protein